MTVRGAGVWCASLLWFAVASEGWAASMGRIHAGATPPPRAHCMMSGAYLLTLTMNRRDGRAVAGQRPARFALDATCRGGTALVLVASDSTQLVGEASPGQLTLRWQSGPETQLALIGTRRDDSVARGTFTARGAEHLVGGTFLLQHAASMPRGDDTRTCAFTCRVAAWMHDET